MIFCKELNKSFESKTEMVKALLEHHDDIIAMKKSAVKFSEPSGFKIHTKDEALKDFLTPRNVEYGDFVYPVINTSNYMDSHRDVHIPGLWKKSLNEQQGKVFLIINHDLEVGKVISQPKEVEMFVKDFAWKDLGSELGGQTEALIFKAKLTQRSNIDGFNAYKYGDPVQHSIRMMYDKIYFCMDPEYNDDADSASYNDNWEKYFPQVANAEHAKEVGYFWAVTEARIFKEGSMVLLGSNDITPTLYDITEKSSSDTSDDNEPPKSTQPEADALQKYLLNI